MTNQEILNHLNDLFGIKAETISFFVPLKETAKDVLSQPEYLYFSSLLSRYEHQEKKP